MMYTHKTLTLVITKLDHGYTADVRYSNRLRARIAASDEEHLGRALADFITEFLKSDQSSLEEAHD